MQISGRPATLEERANLNERYPLNAHAQCLVGLGDDQRLPEDEDVNSLEHSQPEPKQPEKEANDCDDVDVGANDDDWEATERDFSDEEDDEE